jgi:hypothetical protein
VASPTCKKYRGSRRYFLHDQRQRLCQARRALRDEHPAPRARPGPGRPGASAAAAHGNWPAAPSAVSPRPLTADPHLWRVGLDHPFGLGGLSQIACGPACCRARTRASYRRPTWLVRFSA